MRKILWVCLLVALAVGGYFIFNFIKDNGDYSDTPIEAVNKIRGDNSVDYVIHEHAVSDGEVIFYLRNPNDDQIVVSHEYVRKTWRGWKYIFGGSHAGSGISLIEPDDARGDPFSYQFSRDLSDTEIGKTPFPMLHGIIMNPTIQRVVVKDYITGLERQAAIINLRDKFKLYYVFMDANQGLKFDIITYDNEGQMIYTKTIDDGIQNQADAGTEVK